MAPVSEVLASDMLPEMAREMEDGALTGGVEYGGRWKGRCGLEDGGGGKKKGVKWDEGYLQERLGVVREAFKGFRKGLEEGCGRGGAVDEERGRRNRKKRRMELRRVERNVHTPSALPHSFINQASDQFWDHETRT